MLMRTYNLILLFFLIFSCNNRYENKKVEVSQSVTIWNEFDEPPSINICDKFKSEIDRINCFETELIGLIYKQLDFTGVKVKTTLDDTIKVSMLIDKTGTVSYLNSKTSVNIEREIPSIDSLLINAISNLPKVFPATKTNVGVQVNSKFELPIIIKTN